MANNRNFMKKVSNLKKKEENQDVIDEINEQNVRLKREFKERLFSGCKVKTEYQKRRIRKNNYINDSENDTRKFDTFYTNQKFVKNSSKTPIYVKVNKYSQQMKSDIYEDRFEYYENYRQDQIDRIIRENFGISEYESEDYQKRLQLYVNRKKEKLKILE